MPPPPRPLSPVSCFLYPIVVFKNLLRIMRITAGVALLLIGIIGLLIPILQGWLFLALAVPLISPRHGKKMVEKGKYWWNKWFSKKKRALEHEIIDQEPDL